MDYAKAFDHVDLNILLHKLEALEIPDPLPRRVEAFLTDRHHVKIGHPSDWLEIWGTVPQGTLIGVLFFIFLINDLTTNCPNIKYVDDTTIYHISSNPHDDSLQQATDTVFSWSTKSHGHQSIEDKRNASVLGQGSTTCPCKRNWQSSH